MARVSEAGIEVEVPAGWDVEFYRRDPSPAADGSRTAETTTTVVHLANWPLPVERGDYGGGAVELMLRGDVLIVLFEFGAAEAGTALFSTPGVPWPLTAADFDPNRMQRPLPGQAGAQRFFTEAGRPFCLYVVLGWYQDAEALVEVVNEVLATVEIT